MSWWTDFQAGAGKKIAAVWLAGEALLGPQKPIPPLPPATPVTASATTHAGQPQQASPSTLGASPNTNPTPHSPLVESARPAAIPEKQPQPTSQSGPDILPTDVGLLDDALGLGHKARERQAEERGELPSYAALSLNGKPPIEEKQNRAARRQEAQKARREARRNHPPPQPQGRYTAPTRGQSTPQNSINLKPSAAPMRENASASPAKVNQSEPAKARQSEPPAAAVGSAPTRWDKFKAGAQQLASERKEAAGKEDGFVRLGKPASTPARGANMASSHPQHHGAESRLAVQPQPGNAHSPQRPALDGDRQRADPPQRAQANPVDNGRRPTNQQNNGVQKSPGK